jgi:hypothetical protein
VDSKVLTYDAIVATVAVNAIVATVAVKFSHFQFVFRIGSLLYRPLLY